MNTPEKKRIKHEPFHPASEDAAISLEKLSLWIAADLDRLVNQFDSFVTRNSIRNSISRKSKTNV